MIERSDVPGGICPDLVNNHYNALARGGRTGA